MASKRNGSIYIGFTTDLVKRVRAHKRGTGSVFTRTYKANILVYYEKLDDRGAAVHREKQLKWWKREFKLALIEARNPEWKDLWEEIAQ